MAKKAVVALVGGETLLAREIRDLLSAWKPAPRVQLISAAADGSPAIAVVDEEAEALLPLNAESLEDVQVAFLTATASASRRAQRARREGGPVLIDLAAGLEDLPEARLRAPSAEKQRPEVSPIQLIANPAAIALTLFLSRLAKAGPLKRTVAHVFEPASELGQPALDELQKQTVGVLTFQKLKQDVFDTQIAFNLLARYGEEAIEPLEHVEQRVERHLASLLSGWPEVPMPSVRMIQAPVFHGQSFSLWVEFDEDPGLDRILSVLDKEGIDVRQEEPPTNASIAGQAGISAGAICRDTNHQRAYWFWVVADNLRLSAENAVAVAQEIL